MESTLLNRIYLSPPAIDESDVEAVVAALRSGWAAPAGPELAEFEREICNFTGAGHAVALSSGSAAIQLGLKALGVSPGDSVFCPTLTFGATAFAIVHTGARPVFVDAEPVSWNIDPELLATLLDQKARVGELPTAIVAVDLFGRPCHYDPLLESAERYEIPVLVDAAESLGASYMGRAAGTTGKVGIYSFNGNKIMTTSGGGMLVSDEPEIVERVRYWSTQSREDLPWYEHKEIGYNYRMSNILAALGRSQLRRLPETLRLRLEIRDRYAALLADYVSVVDDPPWGASNGWLTTVLFDADAPDDVATTVREALERQNIESRPVWKPLHRQPVFKSVESHLSGVADDLFFRGLCLPSGTALADSEICRIVEGVRAAVANE